MKYEMVYEDYVKDAISGTIQKISKNADNLMKLFADAVAKNAIQDIWGSFAGSTEKMEALINYFKISESEEKQRIYYFAVMRTVLELGNILSVQIVEKDMSKQYRNYKYIYPVLEILSQSGSLSQGQIAVKLGINGHSLSNFFGRTNQYELWRRESVGRKNYYTITAKGKRVYREYLQQSAVKDDKDFEKMLIVVLDAISTEMESVIPDQGKVIKAINRAYGRGTSAGMSSAVKVKLVEVFKNREVGVRKRKQREQIKEETISQIPWSGMDDEFWISTGRAYAKMDDEFEHIYGREDFAEVNQ